MQVAFWTRYMTIDAKIANAEQVKDSLSLKMKEMNVKGNALMNKDSPYATTINRLVDIEKEVLQLRQEKINIQKDLLQGEIGFNSYWGKLARPEGMDIDLRKVQ